jgi:hypothetical protein
MMATAVSGRTRLVFFAVCCAAMALSARPLRAAPVEFLSVGDPLEAELRWLDVLGGLSDVADSLRLRHLGMRPLQFREIDDRVGRLRPADLEPERRISLARLRRTLIREATDAVGPDTWGRWLSLREGQDQRAEASVGLEGRGELLGDTSRFVTGSGLHGRIGLQTGGWFGFAHLYAGHVENGRSFADPIASNSDAIVFTEESYLGYTDPLARWAVQFGRSRWHWGPGDEGSLVLSKTSAPLTALAFRARIEPLRADVIALSATLDAAAGEQLAAHRIEWQPVDRWRIGVTEAARYRSDGWEPLYAVGVIPYVVAQRIQVQEEPDSVDALRNNVMVGIDAAWRVAPGTRVYGELVVDDLHSRTADNPDKLAYQLGLEGAAGFRGGRITWGAEFTRLTRFVYSSFFGRSFASQGRALGFPTGPDSRRVRAHGEWDLSEAWQLRAAAARTDHGENDVDEPFVPGSPAVSTGTFEGVVEQTRDVEAGLRWWPTSGADLTALIGYRWVEDAGHVPGERRDDWTAALVVRLTR